MVNQQVKPHQRNVYGHMHDHTSTTGVVYHTPADGRV